MPSRKKNSGLLLYSRLRKEVNQANKKLKHPLSYQKQQKLIKEQLFPQYKGKGYSRVNKTDLRNQVTRAVASAGRRKSSGPKIYNRLLHEVSRLNQRIPKSQQLSISERRNFVSDVLYPKYKGKAYRTIDWEAARKHAAYELRKIKLDVCDVTAVQANLYQHINFFEINEFLSATIPPCIYVEVVAGQFGRTPIFNTKDYNYYDSGVQQITNNINKAISRREIPGDTNNIPKYIGDLQVRPKKENDNDPENYYLKLTLAINDVLVEEPEPLKLPRTKKTAKRKKIAKQTREYINERIKRLKAEKSKSKTIRRKVAESIHNAKAEKRAIQRLIRNKRLKPSFLKQLEKDFFKEEKKKLDAAKREKKLKKYQYDELLRQIRNAYKS